MTKSKADNKRAAGNIHLSPDDVKGGEFVGAMLYELDFLKNVSKYPLLFTPGPVLYNAIRRYEIDHCYTYRCNAHLAMHSALALSYSTSDISNKFLFRLVCYEVKA